MLHIYNIHKGVIDMSWISMIQQAINYMEENLLEDITVEHISRKINISSYHFQKTFSILTGITISDYLRKRRLSLAAEDLIQSNFKIIDIALKYGYDTPEAFSKAFRRQHGLSPTDARKRKGKLHSYNRLQIQVILRGADMMKYKIVERSAFQIVGVNRIFSLQNDENLRGIPSFWEECNNNGFDEELFKINDGDITGVLGVCMGKTEESQGDKIEYWIATEYPGLVPTHMKSFTIPTSKWAVFEVHGPMPDAMSKVWKKIFSEWFPSSGYEHAGLPEFEVYSEDDPSSLDLYSEIWIPIR